MQRNTLQVLKKLHELSPVNADLAFLARPEHGDTALRQQIGYQRWYYDWARDGMSYPLIDATFVYPSSSSVFAANAERVPPAQ